VDRVNQRVRQTGRWGGRLAQRMDSSIPAVSVPQAVFTALRNASSSVCADAVAQFDLPSNVTQAEHSTCCADSVDQRSNAANPTASRMVMSVPRFMESPVESCA
jgi:hypothetical protein